MKILAKLSRSKIPPAVGADLDLLVRLRAPAPPADHRRPPLCIVPVVDVSGSMMGAKLAAVRDALLCLVDHLVVGDYLGLVAFDSLVHTLAPVAEVTEARKRALKEQIRKLASGTNTNLAGGLLEGLRLAQAGAPSRLRARVVALTDGCANVGPAVSAEALAALVRQHAGPTGVSCFGYGDDCDHAVLAEMADAGGGSFAFIANEDAVLTAFARELGGLVATYAADVRVRVVPVAGAPVEERLGDLLHHGELAYLARIAVPPQAPGSVVEIASVEATWRDVSGRTQSAKVAVPVACVPTAQADVADDPDVARAVDERSVRQAQEEAERRARERDFAGARRALADAVAKVRDPELARFVQEQMAGWYDGADDYATSAGKRVATSVALKGKRLVGGTEDLGPTVATPLSEIEEEMMTSFRKGKGPKPVP